eukprot:COSAG01_NODE_5611_length_4146_cov_4.419323_1_plen_111_part_10
MEACQVRTAGQDDVAAAAAAAVSTGRAGGTTRSSGGSCSGGRRFKMESGRQRTCSDDWSYTWSYEAEYTTASSFTIVTWLSWQTEQTRVQPSGIAPIGRTCARCRAITTTR